MRRIISQLSDIRSLQLERMGRQSHIAEARDMFRYMDSAMNGMSDPASQMTTTLGEAMTSADFTYAIQEFVSREMRPAYEEKRFAFEPLIQNETVPNYLPVTRYQMPHGLDDLEYTPVGAPIRPGSVPDADKKQFQVYIWQKSFDFHMTTLVNDDLGYFSNQATQMGRSARRTLEKYVSRMYTNATSILRLTGLGANYSTTGRLTSARISTARMAFAQRTDAAGNPMNAALRYIVHHTGLIDTVRTIRQSQLVPELATNAANVVAGDFVPIEDPYIVGTAPNLPWWAFAAPGTDGVTALILARRQGMPGPMLIRKRSDMEPFGTFVAGGGNVPPVMGDFATGSVEVKVYDEWGTYIDGINGELYDYRGAYYSAGTAT